MLTGKFALTSAASIDLSESLMEDGVPTLLTSGVGTPFITMNTRIKQNKRYNLYNIYIIINSEPEFGKDRQPAIPQPKVPGFRAEG